MIAEFTNDDLRDQSWSGDAASNWPHRRRWTRHAIFAVPTGVLGSQVHVHFELRRNVFQDSVLVLADAVLGPTAARTLLVRLAQVVLVPKVRQLIEVEFPATATSVDTGRNGPYLGSGGVARGQGSREGCRLRGH